MVIITVVLINLQRLQLEEYGSCVTDTPDITVAKGTKGILDIYTSVILPFILLGLSFLTSLIHSPVTFHQEAVHSLRAITLALLPISSLYIVRLFLNINVKLKNLEPILWIGLIADVFLPILIMLILFGSSVSDNNKILMCDGLAIITSSQIYTVVKKYYMKLKKGKCSCELTNRYHQLLKEKEDLKIQLSKVKLSSFSAHNIITVMHVAIYRLRYKTGTEQ